MYYITTRTAANVPKHTIVKKHKSLHAPKCVEGGCWCHFRSAIDPNTSFEICECLQHNYVDSLIGSIWKPTDKARRMGIHYQVKVVAINEDDRIDIIRYCGAIRYEDNWHIKTLISEHKGYILLHYLHNSG